VHVSPIYRVVNFARNFPPNSPKGKGVRIAAEEWHYKFLTGSKRSGDKELSAIVESIGSLEVPVPITEAIIRTITQKQLKSYAEDNHKFSAAKIFVTNNQQRCEYNYLRAVKEARDKSVPLVIWYNVIVQPTDVEHLGN
jgi:hypothetical protein